MFAEKSRFSFDAGFCSNHSVQRSCLNHHPSTNHIKNNINHHTPSQLWFMPDAETINWEHVRNFSKFLGFDIQVPLEISPLDHLPRLHSPLRWPWRRRRDSLSDDGRAAARRAWRQISGRWQWLAPGTSLCCPRFPRLIEMGDPQLSPAETDGWGTEVRKNKDCAKGQSSGIPINVVANLVPSYGICWVMHVMWKHMEQWLYIYIMYNYIRKLYSCI